MNKPNIILITIDCLRADHLHCYGYDKKISPNIDKIAKEGILFNNAFSNGPYTLYSIPSFISSILPPVNEEPKETISTILKKYGYSTAAFNPNTIFFLPNTLGYNITKGFDHFDLMLSKRKQYKIIAEYLKQSFVRTLKKIIKKEGSSFKILYKIYNNILKIMPELLYPKFHELTPNANEINKGAIKWLKGQDSTFFLWLHYMDVHEPYVPVNVNDKSRLKDIYYLVAKHRDFPELLTQKDAEKLKALYDEEIKYTDSCIGKLLKKLEEMKKLDNTIIIISSDHGDAFGEHNTYGHEGKFQPCLYEELIHVPLLIYGTNKQGIKINKMVELLDLAPSICKLIGEDIPLHFFGKDFFNSKRRGIISNCTSCISYRTEKYKLIINKSRVNKNELYNLLDDPKEKINIYYKERQITRQLEKEMMSLLKNFKKKRELLYFKQRF